MALLGSVGTLEQLKSHFEAKLQYLQKVVDLTCSLKCPEIKKVHNDINKELDELEDLLDKMEAVRDKRRLLLKKAEDLENVVQKINLVADSTSSVQAKNLLAVAPQRVSVNSVLSKTSEESKKKIPFNQYLEEYESERGYTREMTSSLSRDEVRIHPTFLLVTEMVHVKESELTKISKYMKGRMTPEKVNVIVDVLNQACAAKYEILRTPKSKQSDRIRTAIREYRDQETKETEGFNFIIDNDVLTHTDSKLDKSFHNVVTVLRLCGRLREVRGNGLLRYVFLPSR